MFTRVLCFRIVVMDHGKLVEFDSPSELLKRPDGIFYSIAKDAKVLGNANDSKK